MKDREESLLELIAKATGHTAAKEAEEATDGAEVPDNIAFDSGLTGVAAE
jgi:hypothetical protein